MAHLPCQCSAYMQFPCPPSTQGTCWWRVSVQISHKSKPTIVPLKSHSKILFTLWKNLGGKLSLLLLLLKLDSHFEHHAHSEMSFEVTIHSLIIQ